MASIEQVKSIQPVSALSPADVASVKQALEQVSVILAKQAQVAPAPPPPAPKPNTTIVLDRQPEAVVEVLKTLQEAINDSCKWTTSPAKLSELVMVNGIEYGIIMNLRQRIEENRVASGKTVVNTVEKSLSRVFGKK